MTVTERDDKMNEATKQMTWVFDCIRVSRLSFYYKAETTLRCVDEKNEIVSQHVIESTATNFITAQQRLLCKMIDIADGALDWLNVKHPLLNTLSIG